MSSDGTAVAPQTGSWCRVLLYLRLLSFHCFYSLSEPPAFPLILPATWLLSHFIFSYTETVSRSATKSCGWHTLFGLLRLLYWQFLGLHFHTLKNQLWCLHLTSFPPQAAGFVSAEVWRNDSGIMCFANKNNVKRASQFFWY